MIMISFYFCRFCVALVINFNPSGYSGSEGESVTLMAMLNRPADREITVTVTTQDGTAQGI